MKILSQIGEQKLIQEISKILNSKNPSVLCGIGDDAAVLRFGNKKLLLTTDALLESVHFDWQNADPFLLGRKSLAVNLSDIAAMGGKPLWALVSIALPSRESIKKVANFHRGLKSMAQEYGVSIVGGDTDRSPDGWKITVTVVGEADRPLLRSGARVGDGVWVTGCLGSSALGWELLKKEAGSRKLEVGKKFLSAHLNPKPRVREGLILSMERLATSLIDVSDGLHLDLTRLCEVSRVGARLSLEQIPLAKGFLALCKKVRKDPYALALTGGEDYELLFTAPSGKGEKIRSAFRKLRTPVTCIGEVVPRKEGVRVLNEKWHPVKITKKGYQHF
jgi:thiamine-monophosphate kinase